MTLTKRQFLIMVAATLPVPALAFSGSTASKSPLPGIDVTLTSDPAPEAPYEAIHIDGEHGKALTKMGPKQAATLLSNILSPKLEEMSGISGKTWHWVLANHLSDEVVLTVFNGGATELQGMQFADDNGATTWGLRIAATK